MKKTYIIFLLCLIVNLVLFLINPNKKIKVEKRKDIIINLEGKDIELEEYIAGVVSCEMPALFEEEALKAMAVAARTFDLNKVYQNPNYIFSSTTNDQCYNNENELHIKWDSEYDKYYKKIKKLVHLTKNEYLSYSGEPIKAYYFSTSNGYTENVKAVFGTTEPYLESVSSKWDMESKTYSNKTIISKEEFIKLLDITSDYIIIDKINRNETNHIESIEINNHVFKGIEIRKLLKLRSTDFDIKIFNNYIEIITYGYGHGVGMSQYGANYLAKQGYDYEYILKYYYNGVQIKSV